MKLNRSLLLAVWGLCSLAVAGQDAAPQSEAPPRESEDAGSGSRDAEPAGEAARVELEGRWLGAAALPNRQIDFVVTIDVDESGAPATGTMDMPAQNQFDAPLRDFILDGRQLTFTLDTGGDTTARFDLEIGADGDTMEGLITQGEGVFPARLRRAGPGQGVGPARPQIPTEPVPYEAHEVSFTNERDGITLTGTLTVPEGEGPHPAAVLLTGSGPQDRDESIARHKPFLVIADHLTRNGIAVVRYDDRGVGGSGGSTVDSTIEDFARDGLAAIGLLESREEIHGGRIGLIGHSEGGAVASVIAAQAPDKVDFVVLLAGMGVRGDEVLLSQMEAIATKSGLPQPVMQTQLDVQREILEKLAAGASAEELRPLLAEAIRTRTGGQMPDRAVRRQTEAQLNALTSPWFRHLMAFDPRGWLANVRCPVLALNGALDVQVPPEVNLPAIESALREGGNEDVTVRELEGLNHLFQPAETGLLNEYAQIETTFDPGALELMTAWISERVSD